MEASSSSRWERDLGDGLIGNREKEEGKGWSGREELKVVGQQSRGEGGGTSDSKLV